MCKQPDHPYTVSEIFKRSFAAYRYSFSHILPLVFIMTLLGSVPGFLHLYLGGGSDTPHLTGWDAFVVVFMTLVSAFFFAVVLHYLRAILSTPDSSSVKKSIEAGRAYIVPLFIAMMISSVMTILGVVLFVLPGVFLSILFMFIGPYVVFEDRGPIQALYDSATLVWGNWWHTFIAFLVPVAITLFVVSVLSLSMGYHSPINLMLMKLGVTALVLPFYLCLLLTLFDDLQLRTKLRDQEKEKEAGTAGESDQGANELREASAE